MKLWMIGALAVITVPITALFALNTGQRRPDIAYYSIFFYVLFASAAAGLGIRMLNDYRRTRLSVTAVVGVVVSISTFAAVMQSIGVQHAMGRWSIQTLSLGYDHVQGRYAPASTVPPMRRAAVEADLRRVGIVGIVDDPFVYLYCRAEADRSFPAYIPKVMAWESRWDPRPTCSGGKPVGASPSWPG
jgi:hypothetical protein